MPTIIEVAMDETIFTTNHNAVLVTKGISTCIAFAIRGTYWSDEDDVQVPFCGLYHWSGFDFSPGSPVLLSKGILANFFSKLRMDFDLEDEEEVTITSMQFIGGEKAQYDDGDHIIVSGTEAEVTSLCQAVSEYDFVGNDFKMLPDSIEHHHFLTTNEETIEVTLDTTRCQFSKSPISLDIEPSNSPQI